MLCYPERRPRIYTYSQTSNLSEIRFRCYWSPVKRGSTYRSTDGMRKRFQGVEDTNCHPTTSVSTLLSSYCPLTTSLWAGCCPHSDLDCGYDIGCTYLKLCCDILSLLSLGDEWLHTIGILLFQVPMLGREDSRLPRSKRHSVYHVEPDARVRTLIRA